MQILLKIFIFYFFIFFYFDDNNEGFQTGVDFHSQK